MPHKLPCFLLGLCLFAAGITGLSRLVRGNMSLGNHYAKIVAGCLNGHGFKAPQLVVLCSPVPVGP